MNDYEKIEGLLNKIVYILRMAIILYVASMVICMVFGAIITFYVIPHDIKSALNDYYQQDIKTYIP